MLVNKLALMFYIFLTALLLSSCNSNTQTDIDNSGLNFAVNAPVSLGFPIANLQLVQGDVVSKYAPPPIGTRYIISKLNPETGVRDSNFTYKVLSHSSTIGAHKGWSARWGNKRYLFYGLSGNELGAPDDEHALTTYYSEPRKLLKFPMKPGDSWSTVWKGYITTIAKSEYFGNGNVSVLKWEDVTVPAGTYKALKLSYKGERTFIARGPIAYGNTLKVNEAFNYWYAPSLGLIIKKVALNAEVPFQEQLTVFETP